MSLDSTALLERREFDAAALAAAHPPRWAHAHKRAVYELTGAGPFAGTIGYSRWKARALPELLPPAPVPVEAEAEVYDYRDPGPAVWHVNFADPRLFVAYGSALLAQDELQALEHPQLGSVREALLAEGLPALTEVEGQPTAVLVSGVERRCALDTAPGLGRNTGLYGQRFAAAPFAQVRAALTLLDPAPRTNLIAIAAPSGGRGRYRLDQLEHILVTAYSGFAAATDQTGPIDLRTGFWGAAGPSGATAS